MAMLATKIHPPAPRRDLVPRSRLAQRLGPGERPRLVLVSAPAGFGKTTLLCQWLAEADDDPQVAWLSLDATDNDPRRFLENVVAALQVQGRLPEAAQLVATGAEAPVEVVLTAVVNDLDLEPGRTLLVLDDYHVIEAPEVHRAVTFVLDHLPPEAAVCRVGHGVAARQSMMTASPSSWTASNPSR
ncbi:hypothetical protein [Knoellia sp. p5-6-4]|uniref:hypothetical protein n=1 Tax=unclassified Knoellia TaxID=2618719 RepID=UPI0023DA203C|nr:hypothetical protein [Knoellia sp. p5-6-4]MDF2143504.1 hypothetical protein [Knoellia sp. p5-6-4]